MNASYMAPKPCFRGSFHPDEDPEYWRTAMKEFPNNVPRFDDKPSAEAFVKKYCKYGSNPFEPGLHQSISTLTTWEQIEDVLLPKIRAYDQRWPSINPTVDMLQGNRFVDPEEDDVHPELPSGRLVYKYLSSRLNLPIHRSTSIISTENTLKYLFFHMRCGIFVMIRDNKIVIFCPFVNKHYRNTWGNKLSVEGDSLDIYYKTKAPYAREENFLPDKNDWWANGNIICNEHVKPSEVKTTQWWGDNFLLALKDMIAETCRERTVPDCDFFLNKRDYPQLKYNMDLCRPVEPYGFIFDKDDRVPDEDVELEEHRYSSYAPIMSFYSSERFADVLFPPSEDWEAASGKVFPPSFDYSEEGGQISLSSAPRDLFTDSNFRKFQRSWEARKPTAFFRGTATGGGVTPQTNQRLHVALLSYQWGRNGRDGVEGGKESVNIAMPVDMGSARSQEHDLEKSVPGSSGDNEDEVEGKGVNNIYSEIPLLDAKITGWNLRDKKIAGEKMTFIRHDQLPFTGGPRNFTPIYEQSTYKYLLYVEGHCAACRYGFMMRLGSVILKVESRCVADQMWYFPLLRPYYDHVPVAADLSDLKEQIEWCRENDDECRIIAENAKNLYDRFISKEGILDYLQAMFVEVSRRRCTPPIWARGTPVAKPPPRSSMTTAAPGGKLPLSDWSDCCCQVEGKPTLCARCAEIFEQKRRRQAVEKETKLVKVKEADENRKRNLERMREAKRKREENSNS